MRRKYKEPSVDLIETIIRELGVTDPCRHFQSRGGSYPDPTSTGVPWVHSVASFSVPDVVIDTHREPRLIVDYVRPLLEKAEHDLSELILDKKAEAVLLYGNDLLPVRLHGWGVKTIVYRDNPQKRVVAVFDSSYAFIPNPYDADLSDLIQTTLADLGQAQFTTLSNSMKNHVAFRRVAVHWNK